MASDVVELFRGVEAILEDTDVTTVGAGGAPQVAFDAPP